MQVLRGRSDVEGISSPYVCKVTLLNGAGLFIFIAVVLEWVKALQKSIPHS